MQEESESRRGGVDLTGEKEEETEEAGEEPGAATEEGEKEGVGAKAKDSIRGMASGSGLIQTDREVWCE